MSLSRIALAVDQPRDLPFPAYVVGIMAFAIFCVLMMGLLMFGKGRPHS